MSAWGISPYKTVTIPLGDYNADYYLTIVYQAMCNRNWHIGYFNHDGIIAYTNISLESYAEEVSVRIINNQAVIKSECVGYQGFFTDYGKNEKNLELLLTEIEYAEFHLQQVLEESTQELMDSIPSKQFINLQEPPMAGKEKLHGIFSVFIPQRYYTITPILVLINILVYIATAVALSIAIKTVISHQYSDDETANNLIRNVYLNLGFNDRKLVLQGQIWRLLTATFLHFSLFHLLGNMIALIYIGSLVESKVGKWNFLFLYLFTGIISSMVSVMWHSHALAGGASGAIFGLFGIFLGLLSTNFYEPNARRAMLISTVIVVIINIAPIGEGIDHPAHFSGLISGYLFGLLAYFGLTHSNSKVQRWGAVAAGLGITVVFVICSVAYTPKYTLAQFDRLNTRTDSLSREIHHCFYSDDTTRQQKLYTLQHEALPKLAIFRNLVPQYKKLILPGARKREAGIREQLIVLQCQYYQLLYQEYQKQNFTKYRPEINRIYNRINALRSEWGDFVEQEGRE